MPDSNTNSEGLYENRYSVLDGKIQVPADTNLKNGNLIKETSTGKSDTTDLQNEMKKKAYYAINTTDIERDIPRFKSKLEKSGVTYNDKMTIRNIGSTLSKRMQDTINTYRGDDDLGPSEIPYIGFPGNPLTAAGYDAVSGTGFYDIINNVEEFSPGDYKPNVQIPKAGSGDTYDVLAAEARSGSMFTDESSRKNLTRFVMYDAFGRPVKINQNAPGLAMGQAKVLNPAFQFNELDDVRSDFRNPNIGRMYSERIYDFNLPKVLFEVGTVSVDLKNITGLTAGWFGNADGRVLSEYLRDESVNPIKQAYMHISNGISSVLQTACGSFLKKHKMYTFNSRSRTYEIYVQEILCEIASWMELAFYKTNKNNALNVINKAIRGNYEDPKEQEEDTGDNFILTDAENAVDYGSDTDTALGLDSAGTYDNFGIRGSDNYMGLASHLLVSHILPQLHTVDDTNQDYNTENEVKGNASFYETDADVKDIAQHAEMIVPFALQKGVNVSETFSNSTQEHPIMSELNSTGQNNQQQSMVGSIPADVNATMDKITETAENYKENGIQQGLMNTAKDAGQSWLKGLLKQGIANFKGNAEVGMVQAGNARMVLPEIWTDSAFDRQYSLSFNFFSPYGHRLSIFENTIVPLIFLIAMTAPRQVGKSSYTTPFYVKAFSKGLFTTELGMVSSLGITRSEDKNDRTQEGFPRSVQVTMSIKDLVPRLALSLDSGMWGILSQYNEGFRQYISFISNIDLFDSAYIDAELQVYKNAVVDQWSSDNFKSMLRHAWANSVPIRLITSARSVLHDKRTDIPFKSQTGSYINPI